MVIIGQQSEQAGQIVAARADLQHESVKFRQLAPRHRLGQRRAAGQIVFQQLQFRAQPAFLHGGAQLAQAALQRNALAQHRGQLLIHKCQFVVFHAPKARRQAALPLMPAAASAL